MSAVNSNQMELTDFCGIFAVRRKIDTLDNPHTDREVLTYLYHKAGMSTVQIADQLDCEIHEIWSEMDRHNIDTRLQAEAQMLRSLRS